MTKKAEVQRTRMTDEQAEAFLKKYLKDRDIKGKEADQFVRRTAATRLAALTRYTAHHTKPAKKGKAKASKAKGKSEAKKAA